MTQTAARGYLLLRAATVCEDAKKKRADIAAMPRDIGVLLTEIEKEPVPDRLLALARELQEALALRSAEAPQRRRKRS